VQPARAVHEHPFADAGAQGDARVHQVRLALQQFRVKRAGALHPLGQGNALYRGLADLDPALVQRRPGVGRGHACAHRGRLQQAIAQLADALGGDEGAGLLAEAEPVIDRQHHPLARPGGVHRHAGAIHGDGQLLVARVERGGGGEALLRRGHCLGAGLLEARHVQPGRGAPFGVTRGRPAAAAARAGGPAARAPFRSSAGMISEDAASPPSRTKNVRRGIRPLKSDCFDIGRE
jgi:hypothetical protein